MASAWDSLLTAVKASLATVATLPTAVIRKLADELPDDALPTVIVAQVGEETVIESNFAQQDLWNYPVGVFMIETHNRTFTFNAAYTTLLTLREVVRQQLDRRPPLSTMTSVTDVVVSPLSIFDSGNPNAVYDVTGFRCDYQNWETRTNA